MKEDITILVALLTAGTGVFLSFGLAPALIFCGSYVLSLSLLGLIIKK